MDPIGAIPVFVIMTNNNTDGERRSMVRRASLTALIVLLFFGVTQMWLFNFFGFTMGAFRVSGALVLAGVRHVTATPGGHRDTPARARIIRGLPRVPLVTRRDTSDPLAVVLRGAGLG